jgi:hypothetical protein
MPWKPLTGQVQFSLKPVAVREGARANDHDLAEVEFGEARRVERIRRLAPSPFPKPVR